MKSFVVDASVAAKWLLPSAREPFHREAVELFERYTRGEISLAVPDFFWVEVANILWKAVRFARLSKVDAKFSLKELRSRGIQTVEAEPFLEEAIDIAVANQRTVYDSIYVALAVRMKTELVTADEKLVNATAASLPVKWLGAF